MKGNMPENNGTPINAFTQLVAILRDGELLTEASEKLCELVQAVQEHAKGGTLTLKLKITPAGKRGAMQITEELSVKTPQEEPDSTLLFATSDGILQRTDPSQKTFDLKAVEKLTTEVKEVETQPKQLKTAQV